MPDKRAEITGLNSIIFGSARVLLLELVVESSAGRPQRKKMYCWPHFHKMQPRAQKVPTEPCLYAIIPRQADPQGREGGIFCVL